MYRVLLVRFRRRSAVSTMIGGIIVLSLLLTALGTMVFVSQQYDSYQGTVNKMSQKDIDRFSENLGGNGGNNGAVYPGLNYLGAAPGTGCGGTCNQYNMTISNLAGIGTQIARVYINSTSGSCTTSAGGCLSDPVPSAANCPKNCFRRADRFVNPGEYSHGVVLWLAQQLPNSAYGANTITIVTTRGRTFSFQWPFPPVGVAVPAGVAISTGVMKVAYTAISGGYSSANEGPSSSGAYCHKEPTQPISAGSYGTLSFVNPWMTNTIFEDAFPSSGTNHTTVYIYATFTNTLVSAITIKSGSLLIQIATSGSNSKVYFVGGNMIGSYYGNQFYGPGGQPGSPQIQPAASVILIFRMTGWFDAADMSGASFTGSASVTNQDKTSYFGGTILLDGLYVRPSCS